MIRGASTSSIYYHWTYDIFINFRGEDTRHGFAGNLYHALTQKGVRTFFDDEELKKGDEMTPAILKAIQESRMAITIFSKNYASSTFCLNELVHIHQCIKGKGRPVWPIFYDVQPSEVRHQKGNYEQALAMHKQNLRANEEKMQSWMLALQEVADISGLHINSRHGYEYQFIESIVKEIYSKINMVLLHVAEYPVGLDSRLQKINSLLQLGSNEEVFMVGICGIGGMGKTTIARAVYNSIADNFEGLCFLHDIKENSRKLGLEQMQKIMLSKIVGLNIEIEDINEGVAIIRKTLTQKKILLILDNVDKQEQLEKLAGDCDWFCSGSRIIITTRDKHLLVRHGVKSQYDMEAFNSKESLELLNWNAFRNNQVDSSYKEVLNHVICYTQGLPLALEVIGSHLCGMSISMWESMLDVYKRIPNEDIQQRLKVSYDGLKQVEKEIFLDIACFFKGRKLEYVIDIVEQLHGFDPNYGIRVLVDKCLIKIDNGCIEIHDLIQDMGREIVRQESPKEPGNRSRLWFNQDIVHVLEENTGTNEVNIIIQDNVSEDIEVNWDGEAFRNMKNLKILIFEKVRFSKGPNYLPNSLKVLKWSGYPSAYLPLDFRPKELLVFNLPDSCLQSLEPIKMKLKNLSVLNLRGCEYITQIPDLSCMPNLEKLWLQSCKNLIEIHDSVGYLQKLETLNVQKCSRLRTFPRSLKLPSLKQLYLEGCSRLKYFPEILEKMVHIEDLKLVGTGIEKVPFSLRNLTRLGELIIEQHRGVIELPSSIALLPELAVIRADRCVKLVSSSSEPKEGQCSEVDTVILRHCNISDELLLMYLTWFSSLKRLDLTFSNVTILPACIQECRFLWEIKLNKCQHLREIKGIPPSIKHLEAANCLSLSSESRNLLLSQESLGAALSNSAISKPTFFCVPGSSIPEWFNQCSRGPFLSFWCRNRFPNIAVTAVLKLSVEGEVYNEHDYCGRSLAVVFINDKLADERILGWMYAHNDYHIIGYDLKGDSALDNRMKRVFRQGRWNHVEVYTTLGSHYLDSVIHSGIYAIKDQYCGMEDIRFTDPCNRPEQEPSITGEKELCGNLVQARNSQSPKSGANEESVHVSSWEEGNKEDKGFCQTQHIKRQEDEALINLQRRDLWPRLMCFSNFFTFVASLCSSS